MTRNDERLRELPSVDSLTDGLDHRGLSRPEVVEIARAAIGEARSAIIGGGDPDVGTLAENRITHTRAARSQKVVNATGVILHTNLGRAPQAGPAVDASSQAGANYTNTELDLTSGERGSRGQATTALLRILTGAEDALVVNNNAAAVLLAIAALASEKAVPVSRGELIEIGGSYRLPEVMAASGARLIEVGTTNKTKLSDYELAIQLHECAMLLKVHRANFDLSGFTASVDIADLVKVGAGNELPVVYDIGSGLLDESTPWLSARPTWLDGEPGVAQAVMAGADLVMFSGDKLLGGPQAGIVVGRSSLIARLRDHPLRRALRVDASTDAALEATLRSYLEGKGNQLPLWRMVDSPMPALKERAADIAAGVDGLVESGFSVMGAGSVPSGRIPTSLIRLAGRQDMYLRLLGCDPPILARRDRGDLVIDVRTIDPSDDQLVAESLLRCL